MTVLRQCLLLLPCLVAGCKLWDDDLGYLFKGSEPDNAPSFELPPVTDTGSPAGPIDSGDSGSEPNEFEPVLWRGPIHGGYTFESDVLQGSGVLEALSDADGGLSGEGMFVLDQTVQTLDEVGLRISLEPISDDAFEGTLWFEFEGGNLVGELPITARQVEPTKIESDLSGELEMDFVGLGFEGSFVLER